MIPWRSSCISVSSIHCLAVRTSHGSGKSVIEPTYDGSEQVKLELTLGRGPEGLQGEGAGVWAVLNKSSMREIREQRFDLVRRPSSQAM